MPLHVAPEAAGGGALGRVRGGDIILLDCAAGILQTEVEHSEWEQRQPASQDLAHNASGHGCELFAGMRQLACGAEQGAISFAPAAC